ncbi:MAG: hypothetical protein Q9170_005483 [Blastenia crenularia]
MGVLRKVLPDRIYRFLQKAINPPKFPKGKSKRFTRLFTTLQISQDVLNSSLKVLKDLVGSLHDNVPDIIRCELHINIVKGAGSVVHILLRFQDEDSARNLTVDGSTFQEWLESGEEMGRWTCCMYQEGFNLVAGFDRGELGRKILVPYRHTNISKSTPTNRPNPTRKPATTSSSAMTKERTARGTRMSVHEDIEMEDLPGLRQNRNMLIARKAI